MFLFNVLVVDDESVGDGKVGLVVAALQGLLNLVRGDAKFLVEEDKKRSCC